MLTTDAKIALGTLGEMVVTMLATRSITIISCSGTGNSLVFKIVVGNGVAKKVSTLELLRLATGDL